MVSVIMISGPTAFFLIVVCINIADYVGLILIGIPYFVSWLNSLRLIVKVASTDPGIIPKFKS